MEVIYMIIFFAKMIRKIVLIILIFLFFCTITQEKIKADDFDEKSIYAISAAVLDGYNGRVLVSKESNSPMANASTTKILTCIITLELCDLNDEVIISNNAACQPEVKMGLTEGESYILKDLLYGLMLESYNDCATAIAEHVAGDVDSFSSLMNEKAKEIGCKDTYFITPNGLDEEKNGLSHHTTAQDLCKIMNYCVWKSDKKEEFLEITQTKNYGEFINHNKLLNCQGVISGKTGFTSKAGYCYVCAVDMDGKRFSIALLGCGWPDDKEYKWKDTQKLIDYIINNYEVHNIDDEFREQKVNITGIINKNNDLNEWKKKNKCIVKPYCVEDNFYMKKKDEKVEIEYEIMNDGEINASQIGKERIIGSYVVSINNYILNKNNLYLQMYIIPWNYKEFLKCVFLEFI